MHSQEKVLRELGISAADQIAVEYDLDEFGGALGTLPDGRSIEWKHSNWGGNYSTRQLLINGMVVAESAENCSSQGWHLV